MFAAEVTVKYRRPVLVHYFNLAAGHITLVEEVEHACHSFFDTCYTSCQTMDSTQTKQNFGGFDRSQCQLKLVDFEIKENQISHETEGLSEKHLVVRRGKPFKVTLLFRGRSWNPYTECLVLEVWLGSLSEKFLVQSSDHLANPQAWSAKTYPTNKHPSSVTLHICSPSFSSVAVYNLVVHIETRQQRKSYAVGSFVLLCNPWLKDDVVYMPLDAQRQEYIKSDYGLLYMGTNLNVIQRPWSFGQYEPGVLEACLKVLDVSPQHLNNKNKDYILRADPVYLSRVVCAMVNCNDDLGILLGKWQGSYDDGVTPTEWSGSADILHRWVTSKCSPVRYGQCWVFASVLCTVLRVLGIPSRVVTVFNAAHDTNANLKIEEVYSSTGEKLSLSNDSIWNFHVWVECWMRRPDLGARFDGWQVVDSTPQEKSGGIFVCGPCPVVAVQHRRLDARFDTPFVYASVDADIVRLIVRKGLVVGRKTDSESVGQLIYTKSIGSDNPENLTQNYKKNKTRGPGRSPQGEFCLMRSSAMAPERREGTWESSCVMYSSTMPAERREGTGEMSPNLEVSLNLDGTPLVGESIRIGVKVTNHSGNPRALMEYVNAQIKEYNSSPQENFWKMNKEVQIQPHEVVTLRHTIPLSETTLAADDIVNVAVVIKDMKTNERVLETQEFNISSPKITIEIEGGDTIQMKKEHTVQVSFTNKFTKTLNEALLSIEGSGLLNHKHEARLTCLKPEEKIEKTVSIMANSPGTKVLIATFSHSNSPTVVARSFQKVSVSSAS